MANKTGSGVPSQTEVPAQTRYPHEGATEETEYTTALPLYERIGYTCHTEDGKPTHMPIPQRKQRYGEFMSFSHTNGKKE